MTSTLDRLLQRSVEMGRDIQSLGEKAESLARETPGRPWQPRFELYQHQDHLFLDLELPGVPESSIEVESRPDRVAVRGVKPALADLAEREVIASSREYGPFVCQFAIPPGYLLDGLDHRLEHGVLHLRIHLTPRPAIRSGTGDAS